MSGAGQGLTMQIATVAPAGRSGELNLATVQAESDAATGSVDFGQILAEQFSGAGDATSAAPVLVAKPGLTQQLDLLAGAQGDASSLAENPQLNNLAALTMAATMAAKMVPAGLDGDNGDSLPSGGEVLPVLAVSTATAEQTLDSSEESGAETEITLLNLELQDTAADAAPAGGISGELLMPSPAAVTPSAADSDEQSAPAPEPSDNLAIATGTAAAAAAALDNAHDMAAAGSSSGNPAQSGVTSLGELQNRGLKLATAIQLQQADAASSGNDDLMLKTGLEMTRSAVAQGKLDLLFTNGNLTATTADVTLAESLTQTELGTGSAWRSALSSYKQLESGQPVSVGIQIPVGQKGWSESVMEKVLWLSGQHINNAEIHLDPPELGPLQLHISSKGDQASVFFSSSHAQVREALEQGLPRLREMLESNGLQLMDVNVSDRSPQQQARDDARYVLGAAVAEENQDVMAGRPLLVKVPQGLVDDYA